MTENYRIHALVTGETESTLGLILLNEARALNLPPDKVLPFGWQEHIDHGNGIFTAGVMAPVHAWLIEGSGEPLLVDTGLPPCAELQQVVSSQGGEIKPCHQEPEWRLDRQLRSLGIDPGDIRTVVLTHLHGDHYGGNEFFFGLRKQGHIRLPHFIAVQFQRNRFKQLLCDLLLGRQRLLRFWRQGSLRSGSFFA